MLVIILSFEMDYILTLWLENVPKYTPWICRITLATSCVVIVSFVIVVGVQATGEMKLTSFIGGTISIIGVLPTSFFLLKQGLSPYSTYLCYTVVSIVLLFGNVFILKHYVKEFDCPLLGALVQGDVLLEDSMIVKRCGFYKEFKRVLYIIKDDKKE